jgi:hypothetical protein
MARWEPQEPQTAPLIALLDVAVKTDMQESSDQMRKNRCLSDQAGSPAGDVRAAARQNLWRQGSGMTRLRSPLGQPRVALFLATGSVFDLTRDLIHFTNIYHHAAAKLRLLSARAQRAERSVGISGNASNTRLLPPIWILSTLSSACRGSSMLLLGRFVLQGVRDDEPAGSAQGNQAAREVA